MSAVRLAIDLRGYSAAELVAVLFARVLFAPVDDVHLYQHAERPDSQLVPSPRPPA